MTAANLHRYVVSLMQRLRNPAIRHDVGRIGRNGSVKMATRLIQPLRENLVANRDCPCTLLAVAAWIRWFALREPRGTHVHPVDPLKDELMALCDEMQDDPRRLARAFLSKRNIFGNELPHGPNPPRF